MLDRKRELALLLAIGYRKSQVFLLIFSENLFLLLAGLIIGILAALIGILPSLLSPAFTIPGNFMFLLIAVRMQLNCLINNLMLDSERSPEM